MEKLVTFFLRKAASCCFCTLCCLSAARRLSSCFNVCLTGRWRQFFLLMVTPVVCHVCVSSFRVSSDQTDATTKHGGIVRWWRWEGGSLLINITGPLFGVQSCSSLWCVGVRPQRHVTDSRSVTFTDRPHGFSVKMNWKYCVFTRQHRVWRHQPMRRKVRRDRKTTQQKWQITVCLTSKRIQFSKTKLKFPLFYFSFP